MLPVVSCGILGRGHTAKYCGQSETTGVAKSIG